MGLSLTRPTLPAPGGRSRVREGWRMDSGTGCLSPRTEAKSEHHAWKWISSLRLCLNAYCRFFGLWVFVSI